MKTIIKGIWDFSGHNADDTVKDLKKLESRGYDESLDGSLTVFYFGELVVVVTVSGIHIHEPSTKVTHY